MLMSIAINVLSIIVIIYMVINSVKLKAINTRLLVENDNLQYELGKRLVKEQEDIENLTDNFNEDKIDKIKEMYKNTSDISFGKETTKEEVEKFYKEQVEKKD